MKTRTGTGLLLLVLCVVFGAAGSSAAIRVVPDDYPTIQLAVNAAIAGDIVYVLVGTYSEHVTIDRALTLSGEDRNLTIIDGGGSGNVIYVTSDYVTVKGLTIANGENGIFLIDNYTIDHFTLRNAVVTGNVRGVSAPHNNASSYHIIENSIFSHNGQGVYAHQIGYSEIRRCIFFGHSASAVLAGWGSYTKIYDNVIYDNASYGIHIDSGSYNTIYGNEIFNNDGCALSVGYVGNNNTFKENTVWNNRSGICMGSPSVRDNLIYHNRIISNETQGWDEDGDNNWDNGYPSGGNYWSDYMGVDQFMGPSQDIPGADQIGDTPYTSGMNGVDRYPLYVAPIEIERGNWATIKEMYR